MNLLADLRDEMGLAYLFISHDLSVVRHVADRIAVMYLGRLVEVGPAAEIWSRPLHPYTEALLSAVPSTSAANRRVRMPLEGDLPSPIDPPSGCRFRTRCPRGHDDLCRKGACHGTPRARPSGRLPPCGSVRNFLTFGDVDPCLTCSPRCA